MIILYFKFMIDNLNFFFFLNQKSDCHFSALILWDNISQTGFCLVECIPWQGSSSRNSCFFVFFFVFFWLIWVQSDHGELLWSPYCPSSVMRVGPSTFSLNISSLTTQPNSVKVGMNVSHMSLFKSCSDFLILLKKCCCLGN